MNRFAMMLGAMLCSILTGCVGGSGEAYPDWYDPTLPTECQMPPVPVTHAEAPVLNLKGNAVVVLSLGQSYQDAGATAIDAKDSDLSASIKVDGLEKLDTAAKGDYFLRYTVLDSDGHAAEEKVRIVRVRDASFIKYSLRKFGETSSGLGFLEHLPVFYGDDPQGKYPLLIVSHGWGHFVQHSPAENRLSTLLSGTNIYKVFDKGAWPDNRPFIVLSPQRCVNVGTDEWLKVDQFIEWAIRTYKVDTSRIYMTGLSAGGYFTWRYPVLFPKRLAAIAPMSAGGPTESHEVSQFCAAMETMPIWSFHGLADGLVKPSESINTVNIILNGFCAVPPQPTPRLSMVSGAGHDVANAVWDDSLVGTQVAGYDAIDQSLYDWLLTHRLER